MKKIIVILAVCLSFAGQTVFAQLNTVAIKKQLGLNRFLYLVSERNLEYAAEKFNVPISEAAVEQARVFPDPTIAYNWLENREAKTRTGFGYISELGTTIELGGKRKARIDLAKSETKLTQALLDDYFRNLRAEAALVYLEAVKKQQLFEVKESSFQTMSQLAEADSIRLALGSIMETDAIQSKLEAARYNREVPAKATNLAKRERRMDVDVSFGLENDLSYLLPLMFLVIQTEKICGILC